MCLYWLPPLLGTGAIIVLSGDLGSSRHTREILEWLWSWFPFFRPEQLEQTSGYLRKAGHVTAYAVLYFLWFRAFRVHFSPRPGPAVFWSLSLCLLIALLDEGHQSLVPSRTGCIRDVALDFGAAALAAIALSCKRI
jgi:VanZ family protein